MDGGFKMNHMSTLAVNHGAISTKETNKQIQPMIGLGSDKNDRIEDLSKFWPSGQHIWIKIMNLSDVDITKCLPGWGSYFKSKSGKG